MKTVVLLGKVDKRIIVYPIARALSIIGNVLISADDGAYSRLYNGNSNLGSVGKTDIIVDPYFSEHNINAVDGSGIVYDYRLVVSNNTLPDHYDSVIECKGVDRQFFKQLDTGIDIPSDIKRIKVIISTMMSENKNDIAIPFTAELTDYLFDVEEHKRLQMIKNKRINSTIAKIFAQALSMNESQVFKLLTRKNVTATKERGRA